MVLVGSFFKTEQRGGSFKKKNKEEVRGYRTINL